jgi:hypothetical protein
MNANNITLNRLPNRTGDLHALQARFAGQLSAALSERAAALPHDIEERLRFGREQALLKARAARHALATGAQQVVGLTRGGALSLGHGAPWWQRAFSLAPLALIVGGMLLIDQWALREQVMAVADVDAILLADDLPPTAYSDPGFAEYLRSPPP